MSSYFLNTRDIFVINAIPSNCFQSNVTDHWFLTIRISTGAACVVTLRNKVLFEKNGGKKKIQEKNFESAQKAIISSDKLYRISWKDNVIDKTEYDFSFYVFRKNVKEIKNDLSLEMELKINVFGKWKPNKQVPLAISESFNHT